MKVFKYKALTPDKKTVTGLVEAETENEAIEIIKDKGVVIISLEKKSGAGKKKLSAISFGRIRAKDLVAFSRQFSVLITSSVTLVRSLRIMTNQTKNPKLKTVIAEIADEVDGGEKLSSALAKRPNVFSNFFVNVVKAGETSGKLDEVLNYLADELEKDYDMMSKIKGAMIYPAFVLSGLVVVGIVMMVFVLPKLTAVMEESGGELPMATKILIATSGFLTHQWWLLIIIIGGISIGLYFFIKQPIGKIFFDHLVLKLPIFGKLFNRIYLVRFTRSLNTLLVGGVNISKGLKISGDVVSNSVFKNLIEDTRKEVEDGNSIASTFENSKEIPVMVSQMLSIGEETGHLDFVLTNISNFYSKEVNNMIANLMTLMEPIILVIMGIGVGIMVAAIIMPMYNMASQF